jgi:hypothetical protein
MMKPLTRFTLLPAVLAVASLALVAAPASALNLRVPQVGFFSGPLQNYMNIVDPGINVQTQQLDAQVWSVSITGNTDFTLMLKNQLGTTASMGVYNGGAPMGPVPPLFQVFPGGAVAGWYATLHFGGGNLIVSLFNQNSVFMGQTFYPGADKDNFGFYIQGPGGTWFSQDARNLAGPRPQMLAYSSLATPGDFWLCFEAAAYGGTSTFDKVVVNVQSVRPTPAANTTWGSLKAMYR